MKKVTFVSILSIPVLLSACVSMDSQNPNYGYNQEYNQRPIPQYNQRDDHNRNVGTIISIRSIYVRNSEEVSAPGVIIGGIAGGILGHQVGRGSGNTIATIVGAAGGAYVGNEIAKKNNTTEEALEIDVRQYNGQIIRITQSRGNENFRNGDRVHINTNDRGQIYLSRY